MKKFKIGSKYNIYFWDHCLEQFKVKCEVTIYVTKEDKTHVYGTWWRVHTEEEGVEENNREMISIVKAAIIKKRKIQSL